MKRNPKSPTPWSPLNKALFKFLKPSQGWVRPVFGRLGIMAILEKLGLNTLNYGLGNTRSNSKSSVPYFTSNKTMQKWQDHLRVKLCLFERVLGPLGATGSKAIIHRQGNMRNHSESSIPHFTSKEALLNCKGHARVQLCLI